MPLRDGTPEDYQAAAVRHYQDARRLDKDARYDNAGHLIGFAAECAIKYSIYSLPSGQSCPEQHLPHLLPAARKRLGGRVGYAAMYNLLKPEIFADWAVDFRYSPDGKITADSLKEWFSLTKRLFGAANIKVRLP